MHCLTCTGSYNRKLKFLNQQTSYNKAVADGKKLYAHVITM